MGDFNSAINEDAKEENYAANKIPEWEAEKKVVRLNDTTVPTRIPPKKGKKANTLDLSFVNPNLKAYVKKFTVDSKREWTPVDSFLYKIGNEIIYCCL